MRPGQRLLRGIDKLADPGLALALSLSAISLFAGPVALISGCFLAGILAGFQSRVPAWVAIAAASALQIATWPDHFRLEAFSPLIGAVLAPLSGGFMRSRRDFAILSALILAGIGLAIALDRGAIESNLVPMILLCLPASISGLAFGILLDAAVRRGAAWSQANMRTVTRDLLLGRITTGMIHDLAQPINVVSMANGNLSYLLERIDGKDHIPLIEERVQRIAAQTDRAASLLHNFRSFGRADAAAHDVLTVRDALERTRVATISNVRHGGVAIELRGDALDCICNLHVGILQMTVSAALLTVFSSFSGGPDEQRNGTVIIEANLAAEQIIFTVTAIGDDHKEVALSRMEPILGLLIGEVVTGVSGRLEQLTRHDRHTGIRFALPQGR